MEPPKFEDKWKDAFGEAEISPTENVWTNIELDLEKAESISIRRKLTFFKMLAAASIIFAVGVGAFGLYSIQFNGASANLQNLALQKSDNPASNDEVKPEIQSQTSFIRAQEISANSEAISKAENHSEKEISNSNIDKNLNKQDLNLSSKKIASRKTKNTYNTSSSSYSSNENLIVKNGSNKLLTENHLPLELNREKLPSLVENRKILLRLPQLERSKDSVDPVVLMMAKLDQREYEIAKSEKEDKSALEEKLWTSVGFAAGSFNSLSSNISPTASNQAIMANNSSIANKEAKASGFAYTVGVNMGTKISNRWVVQGGVNYLTQSSDYTAQAAVGNSNFQSFRPASINELDKLSLGDFNTDSKLVTTAPYNVNNSVRYVSVPLQAGYLVVDRKLGLQLNAGVSTDLFVRNYKTADGPNLDKIDQGRGEDSPYRAMNFSGLVGTELSYKFDHRYRISLNPGVRYPFNSVYKSNLGVQSAPLTMDIGLRFRYIFQ